MANRKRIFGITSGRCFYCGCKLDFDNFHLNHFRPKNSGGKGKNNYVPSCPECNLCKSCLSVEDFRKKISSMLHERFEGKMIQKYYGVEDKEIKFYFEEKSWQDIELYQ